MAGAWKSRHLQYYLTVITLVLLVILNLHMMNTSKTTKGNIEDRIIKFPMLFTTDIFIKLLLKLMHCLCMVKLIIFILF